jgi:hypothetical protein
MNVRLCWATSVVACSVAACSLVPAFLGPQSTVHADRAARRPKCLPVFRRLALGRLEPARRLRPLESLAQVVPQRPCFHGCRCHFHRGLYRQEGVPSGHLGGGIVRQQYAGHPPRRQFAIQGQGIHQWGAAPPIDWKGDGVGGVDADAVVLRMGGVRVQYKRSRSSVACAMRAAYLGRQANGCRNQGISEAEDG